MLRPLDAIARCQPSRGKRRGKVIRRRPRLPREALPRSAWHRRSWRYRLAAQRRNCHTSQIVRPVNDVGPPDVVAESKDLAPNVAKHVVAGPKTRGRRARRLVGHTRKIDVTAIFGLPSVRLAANVAKA